MATLTDETAKGEDVVAERFFNDNGVHLQARSCPVCDAALDKVGLVNLAYTFEPCDCGVVDYRHLYEQLWHRTCVASR